jgi:hypothetical protein
LSLRQVLRKISKPTSNVSGGRYVLPYLVGFLGEGRHVLIMNVHGGPGVVPGRYAGKAIPIHDGLTPQRTGENFDLAASAAGTILPDG